MYSMCVGPVTLTQQGTTLFLFHKILCSKFVFDNSVKYTYTEVVGLRGSFNQVSTKTR